jgi:hypothetical protein
MIMTTSPNCKDTEIFLPSRFDQLADARKLSEYGSYYGIMGVGLLGQSGLDSRACFYHNVCLTESAVGTCSRCFQTPESTVSMTYQYSQAGQAAIINLVDIIQQLFLISLIKDLSLAGLHNLRISL